MADNSQPEVWTADHLSRLREVILTVIDDGKPLESGAANPWAFYPVNGYWREPGERNITHRMGFVDAVQAEIVKQCASDALLVSKGTT